MNVLIYNGNGTSPNSVKQTYNTLKILLGHAYDVMKVDATTLRNEPWQETCSLLVVPGGRDSPYCEDLQGQANDKIKNYVSQGGSYLGFCAGGYYASKEIEFEKGTPIEVIGSRPLGFYPGMCRGTMYPGFVYNSEKGARSVSVVYGQQDIKTYYNGGGYFVDAKKMEGVEVVCTYKDTDEAAGVLCKVGQGSALLFGVHPEYDIRFTDLSENKDKEKIIKELTESLPPCRMMLSESLHKLKLKVDTASGPELKLTPIYLTALRQETAEAVAARMLEEADEHGIISDANDRFLITRADKDLASLVQELSLTDNKPLLKILCQDTATTNQQGPVHPEKSQTPYFHIEKYYKALLERRNKEWGGGAWYRIGNVMFYSEVITSTQTILDKNYNFSQTLPSGLVCLATNQIAGRGRGKNSWVSQRGALQFSFIVRHSLQYSNAPVVFIQYLIALAIVESIRTREGYENVPLRLKWPNDIYADTRDGLKKVGGLLVNSSFVRDEFMLVIGCGINLNNPQPTVSINDVIQQHDPKLQRLGPEEVLAHALVTFEKFYMEFCEKGMGSWFLDRYYDRWLHSDKLVTLTTHNNEKARIVGITRDYGMLEAVSIDDNRKRYTLQPDGNSFDMLKGLIIKKE
ncbi:biotin holocarboxylase synthetase [Rhizopus azygosporus]|uniref:Biotin holocarboxylase synthetase n=1 Tax=Rhizopus azygosporus TaxID=86630 RepID=A0A367JCD4_RHIAZ|nr:biotin holocarboxylase synthetase [Rhizopus azygosporus]